MTPRSAGFFMPAEWSPQSAVWLSWPHNEASWPGWFEPVPAAFAAIVACLSRYETVCLNASEELQEQALPLLRASNANLANIRWYAHPTNDAWCRDHGAIFVVQRETGEVAATDWIYNAWGGKYPPYEQDSRIAASMAKALGLRCFDMPYVLEGGAIEVNGEGLLLTTEGCLLHPNRNPGLDKSAVENMLREGLGVEEILWLGQGISGDDTDGHIDDMTRFFRKDGVLTVIEEDPSDENYPVLQDNLERLRHFRKKDGHPLQIELLPMPRPCYREGQRMPASYANFLVINGAVLMPTFRQPDRDAAAAEVLRRCFPGRVVESLDCLDIVWGLGTIHCLSQQQPAGLVYRPDGGKR